MGHREGGEGQDVGDGVRQHLGSLGEVFRQLSDHPVGLGVDLFRGELLVDGAHHGGHARLRPLGHPTQQVGHEVSAAALPTGAGNHRGDGLLQSPCFRRGRLWWASEMASSRPLRPRAFSERRKASQKAPSSLAPTSMPNISR